MAHRMLPCREKLHLRIRAALPAGEAARAVVTVHIAAITARAATSIGLPGLVMSLFIVPPHPSDLSRYSTRADT